jgi:triphosphoribosyl-dephospho-CoA synthase
MTRTTLHAIAIAEPVAMDADRRHAVRGIRNAAVRALMDELVTYPKPGLVSLVDNGSHDDMDATSFVRSTLALRRYFAQIAEAGQQHRGFDALRLLGVQAEARMLGATGGVNTHRGVVFNLGLLAAAAGTVAGTGERRRRPAHTLGDIVAARWGADLGTHRRNAASHGSGATRHHGVGGALAEAANGFPSVYGLALPAYRAVLRRGGSANQARIEAFFTLLARLDDTNLLHRGGEAGLAFAQAEAAGFLQRGGTARADWRLDAAAIHQAFIARRLSPGGSADLLAACVFVHTLEG